MPNFNKKFIVTCPRCNKQRQARSDVINKAKKLGKELFCKPCRNQTRFENRPNPKKGTGVRNNPEQWRTAQSYYKAKQRCKLGTAHHRAYRDVEFKFESFSEFVKCVGLRPKNYTLDRINPLGHYEPGNVRWATLEEQVKNRLPRNYWKDK